MRPLPFAAIIGGALACVLVLVAPDARADAEGDAEVLITKGVELREKGRDDEALAVFKQALAKAPSARARAQVALAEQALGMWVLAEADLAAALGTEGDAWIAKNRAPLEGALAVVRKHVASLEVRGAENAEVYLDGARIGKGAGPFRVEAGKRTLEVRASGFHSTMRPVEIPAGGVARETVTLVAASKDDSSKGPGAPHTEKDMRPEDPGRGQRLLGWGFVGTGAALLATGAAGLVVRKGIVDDYNATCPGLGVSQPASCDDQVTSARTWLTVSIITLVGGGVFTVGGIVLVAAAPSASDAKAAPRSATRAPRLICAPGAFAGIACTGAF